MNYSFLSDLGIAIDFWVRRISLLLGTTALLSVSALAEETSPPPAEAQPPPPQVSSEASNPETAVQAVSAKKKKTKGRRASEKEAEGSEAPNRFEADTVIKSRYTINGQSLEVDPD